MGNYDVFISYRRDFGEQTSKVIYDRLNERGYNAFLDIETLRSGEFNRELYSVIEKCVDFIVILSPNALDRCTNEEDWVRLEIAHALAHNKNVIPIMLRGFEFPKDLPADIAGIKYKNGLLASVEFFDAFLVKLYSFLKSKPSIISRICRSMTLRGAVIAIGACLFVAIGLWGIMFLKNSQKEVDQLSEKIEVSEEIQENNVYPGNQEQKDDVAKLFLYYRKHLIIMNDMYIIMEDSMTSCENYLMNMSSESYKVLENQLNNSLELLKEQNKRINTISPELPDTLREGNINLEDVFTLSEDLEILFANYEDTIDTFNFIMNPNNPYDVVIRNRVLSMNRELYQLDAESFFSEMCLNLLPIEEKELEYFRVSILPSFYVMSTRLDHWTRDKILLKSRIEGSYTQQEKLANEYAAILSAVDEADQEALIASLIDLGMTEQEAKEYISNDFLGELKKEQEKLRVKFAPLETDDPYIVWSKALRFLSVNMYEDAINAFEFHLAQMKDIDDSVLIYVPVAINFTNKISETGIDYGIIVVGYEPNKPQHDIYKIGDIVIAVNNLPIHNFTEFDTRLKEKVEGEDYLVTLLRQDENGQLQTIEQIIPAGQSKVAFLNLVEE